MAAFTVLPVETQQMLAYVVYMRGISFLAAAVDMSQSDLDNAIKGEQITELVSARLVYWVRERVS